MLSRIGAQKSYKVVELLRSAVRLGSLSGGLDPLGRTWVTTATFSHFHALAAQF